MAAFIGLFPVCSVVSTYGIRLVLVLSGDEHLFYFISPLDLPITYFLIALIAKIAYLFLLSTCLGSDCFSTPAPGSSDNFDFTRTLNDIFDFVSNLTLIMSVVSGVLIIAEKVAILLVDARNRVLSNYVTGSADEGAHGQQLGAGEPCAVS